MGCKQLCDGETNKATTTLIPTSRWVVKPVFVRSLALRAATATEAVAHGHTGSPEISYQNYKCMAEPSV